MKLCTPRSLLAAALCCLLTTYAMAADLDATGWSAARSSHAEVYSRAGADRARRVLVNLEELRSFFAQQQVVPGLVPTGPELPLRVIGFGSKTEYDGFKVRPTADAYYTGTAERDYIAMPMGGNNEFQLAAHEYSHYVLHSAGLTLPTWLSEGLAELFSTVIISTRRCEIGGPVASHVEVLRRNPWLSAAELLAVEPGLRVQQSRHETAVFYAESWVVVDMLVNSSAYRPRFESFINMFRSGDMQAREALTHVYHRTPEAVLADAQQWVTAAKSHSRVLPGVEALDTKVEAAQLSEPQAEAMMAELLFANGEVARGEQLYKKLLKRQPGGRDENQQIDAILSYRYAVWADQTNAPAQEVEDALKRAIQAKPDLDDARFRLAILKSNAGKFAAAVEQLQRMSNARLVHAFPYWITLAYALSEIDKRDEAESAAKQALVFAETQEERERATQLVYVAKTDLAVRYSRNVDGTLTLVTTRVAHGSTAFNPFIEPADHIEVATGTLREVQCTEGKLTGFLLDGKTGIVVLSVPDPQHVLMRNSPPEFYCGAQAARPVKVEYATASTRDAGVLRGMEFQ